MTRVRFDRNAERKRLAENDARRVHWKRFGPYLAERQWATVREDYSEDGNCWSYFPHDHARSRAYRWGEDGLLGLCDSRGRMCLAIALWNERDSILKERLFGLGGPEGSHGEDVKERYFYLDSTPTHSWVRMLYKYPQAPYPYEQLVEENASRTKDRREFELEETGVFDEQRYFDVFSEFAKASANDISWRIAIANRGPDAAPLHVLPTLWYRNTWSWGRSGEDDHPRPRIRPDGTLAFVTEHQELGRFRLELGQHPDGTPPKLLLTENETNRARVFDEDRSDPYVKDAFHRYVVEGDPTAVNPSEGSKAAAHYRLEIPPNGEFELRLRLVAEPERATDPLGSSFTETFSLRRREADAFYADTTPKGLDAEAADIVRQGYAGLLCSKQFYSFAVKDWLEGDPEQPPPPPERLTGRNSDWRHLYNRDVISMPDKWEYPWYAAWDLAFHVIPFAKVDSSFAKDQLLLLLREWYMHPNGQIPAYEFAFSDVNPPVHAWAAWRVYKISSPAGKRDRVFLRRVFDKLLVNFTWWVNRKDVGGKHLFSGGFLGLDNIGVFDRSQPLPTGGHLEQADGTAWMAFYAATMLAIALELALDDPVYEDTASKFFEHLVRIVDSINTMGGTGLWDEEDGFYYDQLNIDGNRIPLKVRSLVGLIPLLAVGVLDDSVVERLPGFRKRLEWFLGNRKDLGRHILRQGAPGIPGRRLMAIPSPERLESILSYLLDESEFLSPFGIRSVSRHHLESPYVFQVDDRNYSVKYVPGESDSAIFGGNSNWRGPIWFPINFLLIEALERYHHFYGDDFRVECPKGSGRSLTLQEAAREISRRLTSIFRADAHGVRPWHGSESRWTADPHWRDLQQFYEYFDGDTARGLGASHQTGWTALVVTLLEDEARQRAK